MQASLVFVLLAPSCSRTAREDSTPQPQLVAESAHEILLPRAGGGELQPLTRSGKPTRVVLFLATDCPIANGYAPEIARIAAAYRDRIGPMIFVHVDPDVDRAQVLQHAKDYGLDGELVLDREQIFARALGATVTPEVVVLRRQGQGWMISYRGRIDDIYVDFGKKRVRASRLDLRLQLDRALRAEGEPLLLQTTKAIGCPMPKPGS